MISRATRLPVQRWHAGGDWGAFNDGNGNNAGHVQGLPLCQCVLCGNPSAHIAAVWPRHPRQSLGTLWTTQATAVTLLLNLRSPATCWAFLYVGVAPPANEQARPPPPRLSISGDSVRVQVMQFALMGHGTVAPQIEALEHECWGVIWGAGASETA